MFDLSTPETAAEACATAQFMHQQFEALAANVQTMLHNSQQCKLATANFEAAATLSNAAYSLGADMNWVYPAGAAVLALYYGVQKLQYMLIYPSNFPEDSRTEVDNPSSYDMPYKELWLRTSDGVKLHAYYIPCANATRTVVMLGPNAGNIGHSLPLAEVFHSEVKVNVLTVSYRGYGRSEGSPSEAGLRLDAEAVLDYIRTELSHTAIILYGRSLGGAVAIYLASIAGPLIRGLIVENTFLSIRKLIPSVLPVAKPVHFLLTQKWESERTILKLDPAIAAMFVGGERDELVPPDHFRTLFELCPSNTKQFRGYPLGTHNDTCQQPGYWRDLHMFIHEKIPV